MNGTRVIALCLTDIEGSSTLWQDHGDVMPDVLDGLDEVMGRATEHHGGTVVKSRGEGDSHFLVFPLVSGAAEAAASIQRCVAQSARPCGVDLRVRAALHVGEVRERQGDYAGTAINRAARLRSVAHGGQVVASTAFAEMATEVLDDRLTFTSLGRHRVRDFAGWTEIYQLCGPELSRDFPPLVTIDRGLPPIAVIVMLDCVTSTLAAAQRESLGAFMGDIAGLFAAEFSRAEGQYLKQVGDGCLAIFADPDRAVEFAREIRTGVGLLGMMVRCAVHVGRVEFAHHEPVSESLRQAVGLMRTASPARIVLSAAAAALVEPADDLVTASGGN